MLFPAGRKALLKTKETVPTRIQAVVVQVVVPVVVPAAVPVVVPVVVVREGR